MRYCNGSRSRNNVEPDDEPDDGEDERVIRTRALFDALALLEHFTRPDYKLSGVVSEARRLMKAYPGRFDIMRMCAECPMLSAAEAQRIVGRRDHLDV